MQLENIVIQFFSSIGIPGIILAIVYYIFNKQFISLIRSTEFDKLFYTQEKKFILRAWNWVVIIIFTLVLQLFSFEILYINKITVNNTFVQFVSLLLLLIIIFTFIIKMFMKRKIIQKLKVYINDNKIVDALIAISYIGFIIMTAIAGYQYTVEYKGKDAYTAAAVFMIIFSVIIPLFERTCVELWVFENKVNYFVSHDNKNWYLIRPFNSNDFLLGDSKDEYKCKERMIVSAEFLKCKVISSEEKANNQP